MQLVLKAGCLPCFIQVLLSLSAIYSLDEAGGTYRKSVSLYFHYVYEKSKMNRLPSPLSLILGGLNVSQVSFLVVTILALIMIVRFTCVYIRARYEFPGPPVKNFWTGNLDQTMADNVHEKVSQALRCIRINIIVYSGCNGIVNMVTSFRPSVSSFI